MNLIYPALALLAAAALAATAWANPQIGTDSALPKPPSVRGASSRTAVDPVPVSRPGVAMIGRQIAKIEDQAIRPLAQVSGAAKDAHAETAEALVRAREDLARAQVQLAQASAAVAVAAPDAPEPPLPPDTPQPPQPPKSFPIDGAYGFGGYGYGFGGASFHEPRLPSAMAERGALGALIIATSKLEETAMTEIREDMAVMARILTKAVERIAGAAGPDKAMGIQVWTVAGAREPQNLFLEGFGALFHLSVRYPLLAPPPEEEPKAEKEKPQDSTWERTKRELYGPKAGAEHSAFHSASTTAIRVQYADGDLLLDQDGTDQKPIEYDAGRVESLKKALLEALQNASNIRHLDPVHTITLAVQGGTQPIKRVEVKSEAGKLRRGVTTTAGGARQSMMTIRVKKADIDALAKGAIAIDEFTKRATVVIYPVGVR